MPHLISPTELRSLIDSGAPVRVLDVRWRLGQADGRLRYEESHIPGAVYVDMDSELAAHPASPSEGRHPLPSEAAFQDSVRRWGIDDGDTIVVYDDALGISAGRAWWLLRFAGMEDVRLLDGAFSAWRAAGLSLESGRREVPRGSATVRFGSLPVVDMDAAARIPDDGVLIDVRARERYRGDTEPVDPVPGHIPGAVNVPGAELLDADGRLLPADVLRERFTALGVRDDRPLAVYCGSGVSASHGVLALTVAGFSPALYLGSWSQWSNTPGRPVATGDAPFGD